MSSSAAARRVWAIVPAAGRGERFDSFRYGDIAKQYVPLLGATVLEWSLRALLAEPRIHAIVLVHAGADARWPSIAAGLDARKIQSAVGGASRQESVLNGLEHLANQAAPQDWILVHDAARPCLAAWELRALLAAIDAIDAAGAEGSSAQASGAVLAAPIVDTIKRDRGAQIETVDRQGLWRALTPQVFRLAQLRHALQDAARNGIAVTDEAQAIERLGMQSVLVPGSPFNIKLTRAEDLATAAGILTMTQPTKMRIGQGFDVHAFGDGDHVVLGGVTIPYPKGVVAHSDGDVVIHALCDALLGALGEGDIGRHFPDSDPRYRGADSRVFLREVAALMQRAGLSLVNADITVLAEAPRIAAHKAAMAANLAADLGVPAQRVNIKATTTERLGFIGRGEGLAASAAVLLDC